MVKREFKKFVKIFLTFHVFTLDGSHVLPCITAQEVFISMSQSLAKDFSFGSLLKFAFPSIVMMIFMSLYSIVDGLFSFSIPHTKKPPWFSPGRLPSVR